jgi:hypothetical protein
MQLLSLHSAYGVLTVNYRGEGRVFLSVRTIHIRFYSTDAMGICCEELGYSLLSETDFGFY